MENTTESGIAIYKDNNSMLSAIFATGDINKLIDFCKPIAASGVSGFSRPEQVAAVALWSKSKDIELIDALSHCSVVNGRIGFDSHLTRALTQRALIWHETVRSFAPIYLYHATKLRSFTQEEVDTKPDEFKVFYTMPAFKAWKEANPTSIITGVLRSEEAVDTETVIRFSRIINGRTITEYGRFKMSEAAIAGLLTKSNWQGYPEDCLYARAFTRGARRIGGDALFGMYSQEELGSSKFDKETLANAGVQIDIQPITDLEGDVIDHEEV